MLISDFQLLQIFLILIIEARVPIIRCKLEYEQHCVSFSFITLPFCTPGTIWMQQILSLIYADGDLDDVQSKPTIQRAPWIEVPNSNFPERPSPRLNVTHLPYHLVPKALKAKKGKVRGFF